MMQGQRSVPTTSSRTFSLSFFPAFPTPCASFLFYCGPAPKIALSRGAPALAPRCLHERLHCSLELPTAGSQRVTCRRLLEAEVD